MDFNNLNELQEFGFTGIKSISSLWNDKKIIPKEKGVYLILNPYFEKPANFLEIGVGGYFKGKNPNVPIKELEKNYVGNSLIVYIGKAGNPEGKATLFSRLGQYLRFGKGKNVGHWGGRYIWQLANHQELIICWKPTPNKNPREVEKELIEGYVKEFGVRPFANLTD